MTLLPICPPYNSTRALESTCWIIRRPVSSLLRQHSQRMSGSKAVPCVSCSVCMG